MSRIAATCGTDVAGIAHDMGSPFKLFLDQKPETFEALASWANLTPQQMDEVLSWTGIRAGNVRMQFRGGLFVSRALRNPVVRGCPLCLRDDAAQHRSRGVGSMVMRGDWQLRDTVVCVRHRHPLVSLWKSDKPRDRYDILARLREIEGDIMSGALDQPETALTDYDLWLDVRLQDGQDDTWFKEQSLFASTTFCRLLGEELLELAHSEDKPSRGAALAFGFEVARKGAAAIRQALDQIAREATGHLDEPNKAFGNIYKALNSKSAFDDGFAPFCQILRECILDRWPIASGATLLGEVVERRRLHSFSTAAKEIGIGVEVIEHFLLEVGAVSEEDARPWSRRLFDAQAYAALLTEIPKLVGPKAMREAMSATVRELKALENEKVLIPLTRVAKVKIPWRLSDGTTLVEELLTAAVCVPEADGNWETLLNARGRSGLGISNMIKAIKESRIVVGQRAGTTGFHGIVVNKRDVDDLASTHLNPLDFAQVELPGEMSAAEFGRSVGLRDNGSFIALVEAGQTPAFLCTNAKTGRTQYRLTAENISSFHRRFVTLRVLSEETGYHRNTIKSTLEASRVRRFAPNGQDFGPLYLREDVAKAFG